MTEEAAASVQWQQFKMNRRLGYVEDALKLLGIRFCETCGVPHNLRDETTRHLRIEIPIAVGGREDGESKVFCVRPQSVNDYNRCLKTWLDQQDNHTLEADRVHAALAAWIWSVGGYDSASPVGLVAKALCAEFELQAHLARLYQSAPRGDDLRFVDVLQGLGYPTDFVLADSC